MILYLLSDLRDHWTKHGNKFSKCSGVSIMSFRRTEILNRTHVPNVSMAQKKVRFAFGLDNSDTLALPRLVLKCAYSSSREKALHKTGYKGAQVAMDWFVLLSSHFFHFSFVKLSACTLNCNQGPSIFSL